MTWLLFALNLTLFSFFGAPQRALRDRLKFPALIATRAGYVCRFHHRRWDLVSRLRHRPLLIVPAPTASNYFRRVYMAPHLPGQPWIRKIHRLCRATNLTKVCGRPATTTPNVRRRDRDVADARRERRQIYGAANHQRIARP